MSPVALSVLDQTPVPEGCTAAEAVGHTVALARAAEALGYRRYWLAEHHDTPSLAGTAPEVLVAAVAGATCRIRVGSGGVLLPYYSPLKVAEAFRMLHTLHPGRIDLGVGRAAGTDPTAEAALLASGGASGDRHFVEHLADLLGFLRGDLPAEHPYAGVRAMPDGPGEPEVWLLGSSSHSSSAAGLFGLSFAFAHFITPDFGPQLVAGYRRRFRPGVLEAPRVAVAVSVLCADTDADARRQASTTDLWRLGPEGSARPPISPPDAVAAHRWTELERVRADQARAKSVVGPPEVVRPRLEALAADFGVDELIVLTVCHDPAARLRSYELLAEAFDLAGPGRPPPPGAGPSART
ncbi:MAG: LLM class flavin-dependent oxidoreductase [Acidimicrobiales bacterium]